MTRDPLVLVVVVGALYWAWQSGALDGLVASVRGATRPPAPASPLMPLQPPASPGGPAMPPAAGQGIGFAATGAGTGAAVAGAAGLAGSAALAATGIGAAAAVLTWAITSKGLFRGGEEGIRVNPMRDDFLGHFAPLDQWRDARNPPGFSGFAALVHYVTGSDGLAVSVFRADREASFKAAVDAASAALASDQARTQAGWAYLASISPFRG